MTDELGGLKSLLGGTQNKTNAYHNNKVDINLIDVNRHQPRHIFNEEKIKELAESIKENGLLQPITVIKKDNRYELIAGERRLRACKSIGMSQIDVIIKENIDDNKQSVLALIENIQRDDLTFMEEALAYKAIMDKENCSQEELAKTIGKNRATVANTLRMLNFSQAVQEKLLSSKKINLSQAKILASLKDKEEAVLDLINIIEEKEISSRELQKLVNDFKDGKVKKEPKKDEENSDDTSLLAPEELKDISSKLKRHFKSNVSIKSNNNKGKISFEFKSKDDLEKIIRKLLR